MLQKQKFVWVKMNLRITFSGFYFVIDMLFENGDTYICKSLTLTTRPKVPSPNVAKILSAREKSHELVLIYTITFPILISSLWLLFFGINRTLHCKNKKSYQKLNFGGISVMIKPTIFFYFLLIWSFSFCVPTQKHHIFQG